MPATDDGSSPPVTFTQRFPFFEIKREVLFVSLCVFNSVRAYQIMQRALLECFNFPVTKHVIIYEV